MAVYIPHCRLQLAARRGRLVGRRGPRLAYSGRGLEHPGKPGWARASRADVFTDRDHALGLIDRAPDRNGRGPRPGPGILSPARSVRLLARPHSWSSRWNAAPRRRWWAWRRGGYGWRR